MREARIWRNWRRKSGLNRGKAKLIRIIDAEDRVKTQTASDNKLKNIIRIDKLMKISRNEEILARGLILMMIVE